MAKDPAAYVVGDWVRFKLPSGEECDGILYQSGDTVIDPSTYEHVVIVTIRTIDQTSILLKSILLKKDEIVRRLTDEEDLVNELKYGEHIRRPRC